MLNLVSDDPTQIRNILPTEKNTITYGEGLEGGDTILNGGNNMFVKGNIFNTNLGEKMGYKTGGIRKQSTFLGLNGESFVIKDQNFFLMAANINGLEWIEVYSKWNVIVEQSHFEFVGTNEYTKYRCFVQMVYPYVKPAHYTMWFVPYDEGVQVEYSANSNVDGYQRVKNL